MTTRNLDALFAPRAIALVGASNEPGSVGNVLARNLLGAGFVGRIMLVNPHAGAIRGQEAFKSVDDLPATPDLAIIATPPPTVPQLVTELGQRGCRAAVVITAGVDHGLRDAMLAAGRPHLMRIIGPNCLGFLSPVRGINASFAHLTPKAGHIAFLTQSGAVATSMIDWASGRNIGFSHVVSLGDMSDVDFGDLLDFLALDPDTSAILMYAESITQARKFMSAGRIAARAKPVIVVKGGRSQSGAAAAASHTGALAGVDAIYDAAFRRAGMLRVDTLRELFDAAETLSSGLRVDGDRLAILTNGGGLGVLAADALEIAGGHLAKLSEETKRRLSAVLPPTWSHANPVDIIGDAPGSRYQSALDILATTEGIDALLVMNCPTGVADSMEAAQATVVAQRKHSKRPIIGCWMGEATTALSRALLSRSGIPNYETPDEAVSAFIHVAEYARNQKALFETPSPAIRLDVSQKAQARQVIETAIADGRDTLTEPEAKMVLAAYNIPVVTTLSVQSPEQAADAARAMGGPVALKILSRQITHKTDVGGVKLDLEGADATRLAAIEMLERVSRSRPDAVVDGFTVQQMIKRPHAHELLLGAVVDQTFGPCLMFGRGGVATEVIADRCIGLPPLNANLAYDMISRTRVAQLLAGYRDRQPAELRDVAAALVALSDLVLDFPEIAELDINPLLADSDGVLALDARIIVRKVRPDAPQSAIRPFPAELSHRVAAEVGDFLVRPIKPEDSGALVHMARQTDPEHLRLRFHGAISATSEARAARLSQIDYDREMALVAEMPDMTFGGVIRLVFDPNFEAAECAVIVRSDLHNHGIASTLLADAIAYARSRGARRVWGDVMTGNTATLSLAQHLGARVSSSPGERGLVRVEFALDAAER